MGTTRSLIDLFIGSALDQAGNVLQIVSLFSLKGKKLSYEGQWDHSSNPTTQANPVYQPNH